MKVPKFRTMPFMQWRNHRLPKDNEWGEIQIRMFFEVMYDGKPPIK